MRRIVKFVRYEVAHLSRGRIERRWLKRRLGNTYTMDMLKVWMKIEEKYEREVICNTHIIRIYPTPALSEHLEGVSWRQKKIESKLGKRKEKRECYSIPKRWMQRK